MTKRSNTAYRQLRISIHTTTQVVTKGENQEAENVQISIHTTTQVVTDLFYLFRDVLCISIHTTTQVVTGQFQPLPVLPHYFNPHHHAGGDWWILLLSYSVANFNPHHHAGGDRIIHPQQRLDMLFQSTPPRRWWLPPPLYYVPHTDFNPHHHAGGDSKSTQLFILISVNFHINLLLQPLTTSKPSKSIPKTPTIPDSPGANLPGVSWVLPIRTGVSEN